MIIVTTSSGRHWQSNTETVSAASSARAGWYPGLRRWHRLLPRGGRGGRFGPSPWMDAGLRPVLGAALSSRVRALRGPPARPAPVPWDRAACAPGAVAMLGCGAQPCRSTRKLWLFLYFFRFVFSFFFFAFLAANLPLQVPWRKQDCAQGAAALPAPPHRARSRGAAPGKGPWAGARPLSPCRAKSPRWSRQCGVPDAVMPPQAIPWGIDAGPRVEQQRTGTAQCLCERVAA